MTVDPVFYETVLAGSPMDSESCTYVVVSGATREFVSAGLEVDLTQPRSPDDVDDVDVSGYALAELEGGVVAIEVTGYADPSLSALRRLSSGGRCAAVVRSNIQAHTRFGCARDGEILFDDDEYLYIEDTARVPSELRDLFDRVWVDLDDEDDDNGSDEEPLTVALAMAEVVTGVAVRAEDLQRAWHSGFFRVPALTYPE